MNYTTARRLEKRPASSVFPELVPVESSEKPVPRAGSTRRQALFSFGSIPGVGGHVRSTTLTFSNMHEYGDLFVDFMRARKKVFVDELHWDVPHHDGMEFDQYDTPFCRWLVLHEFGEILGGLRLSPTTAKCGVYTYMLRDAQRGLLHQIPRDVLFFDAPVNETVWEGTRLFITDAVNAERRLGIQSLLMKQLLAEAVNVGASQLIGLVPSNWYRWIRRMGIHAIAVGPKIHIDGTTTQAALMNVSECVG